MSHDTQILAGRTEPSSAAVLPVPRVPIAIRVATMADLPFLDGLQKKHSRALGYFPTKQFEGYIEMGAVLVAENADAGVRVGVGVGVGPEEIVDPTPTPNPTPNPNLTHPLSTSQLLGYIISRDRYLKRDELGVIYQLCVDSSVQRKLVGAALVKEVFKRSAYGCRLYCCWCAQDLDANYFWESLGFVPIAFRGGSTGKRRVHIFWQRRVRAGDETTPWWFPAKTESGAMREDRLVLPIPPGMHWRDVRAIALARDGNPKSENGSAKMSNRKSQRQDASRGPLPPTRRHVQFGPPGREPPVVVEEKRPAARGPAKRAARAPAAIDPKVLSAARELRDRYLEQINTTPLLAQGKYDVSRTLPAQGPSTPSLPAPQAA